MRRVISRCFMMALFLQLTSCQNELTISQNSSASPYIYPDYIGVTIPPNIAPMNFKVKTEGKETLVLIEGNGEKLRIKAKKGEVIIPAKDWKRMVAANKGGRLNFTVCRKEQSGWVALRPFYMEVAEEPCDSHVSYRLIEPAYEMWNEMALYQRNLENFEVSLLFDNRQTDKGCINCHSFAGNDPNTLLFHVRKMNPGMIMIRDGKVEKISAKTADMELPLVYPSWHPSGNFVAFSTNNTLLTYHMKEKNTVEVYDDASNVVVYDVVKNQLITTPFLTDSLSLGTYPTFSADGRTLYFCTAPTLRMPQSYSQLKYSLCSVSFDPETATIGAEVDTLFNAMLEDKSLSFPRFSPDGKWMMFTYHNYGSFPIWHKDADLWMLNLTTGEYSALSLFNSIESDSYHSWSSNSRWTVFSSRRNDGWYTRLYIGYIDKEGNPSKPFLIPQKDLQYDNNLMKSYNIPEFTRGKTDTSPYTISTIVRRPEATLPSFR